MWLLCVGQSNAANSGENPRGIQVNVFNYFDGKVYPAKDPLLGATGRGSNVWTALGTELVRRKLAAKVVLVPFAVGGTSIERWQPNERVGQRLSEILSILRADKIHVDFVLWEQGESDDNLSGLEYSQRLLRVKGIFSVSGQNAPMIVALASRKRSGILPEVRRGQQMAAELVPCVFPGPDADSVFGPKARPEGIHFSTFGQDQLAVMWADSIQNALSKQRRCGS